MKRRVPSTTADAGVVEASAQGARDRMRSLAAVASSFADWRPRAEVIRAVEYVPTAFPQYDHVTALGGHPIGRFTLIHGPSNHGKTSVALGLGMSFLARGHFFAVADAERTTTDKWVRDLMGNAADHPAFVALPVSTYEQVRGSVRGLCDRIAGARAKGQIPDDTTALVLVDSIRKLVPAKLWEELSKAQKADAADAPKARGRFGKKKKSPKGIDGFGGRAAQLKAALNAAWVDELVPLLADTRIAMAVIARETSDPDADAFASKDWKVGGGSALYYDASLDIRVMRGWVSDSATGEVYGERHRLEIHKTKVAGKLERIPSAHVHVSNGALVPYGFDRARDVIELAIKFGICEVAGSWIKWGKRSLAQGENQAVVKLTGSPLLGELEAEVRAHERFAVPDKDGDA
jgi:RecA/RadA recombinase